MIVSYVNLKGMYVKPVPDRDAAIFPFLDALSTKYPQMTFSNVVEQTYRYVSPFVVSVDGTTSELIIPDLARYRQAKESGLPFRLTYPKVNLQFRESDKPNNAQLTVQYDTVTDRVPRSLLSRVLLRPKTTRTDISRVELDIREPYFYHDPIMFESPEEALKKLEEVRAKIEVNEENMRRTQNLFGELERQILDLGYRRIN